MKNLRNDFDADHQSAIILFLDVVNSLQARKLLENGSFNIHLSMKFDALAGTQASELFGPDEEYLRSALLDIRKLYADGSSCQLERVLKVLISKFKGSAEEREYVDIARSYKIAMKDGPPGVQIFSGQSILTPREMLKLYFNAVYFHDDAGKRHRFISELSGLGSETKMLFLFGIKAILKYAFACKNAIERNIIIDRGL